MKINHTITAIKDYPDNGKHLECWIDLPFEIRKGEDGYYWKDKKGKEHKYNLYKDENKVTDEWIVHLKETCNKSLENIFEIKVDKDLNKILNYCVEVYKKSLLLEIERLNDLSDIIKQNGNTQQLCNTTNKQRPT